LVEQNNDLIYLIQRYGEQAGLRIITTTGLEAVERAQQEQPAAILLEADLPERSSWGILHALKANRSTCHLPVVMYAGIDQRAQILTAGANACLQMPFLYEEFLSALEVVGVRIKADLE
jgi:CheY-like chemotaxis protein